MQNVLQINLTVMNTEQLNIRNHRIETINGWIKKHNHQIITHHENGKTILGLYRHAVSKSDIPEFLKDLIRGTNKEVNLFVDAMYIALNLVP